MTHHVPKVSIGMPVYNMDDTVKEAIDTILSQTFTDFELIICDNASDDGTEKICRTAASKDPRIRYHRNTHNLGGENFRLTVMLAKADYFMWAAADDYRRPEMVSRCVEALDSDPQAELSYTYTEVLDSKTGQRYPYRDSYRLDYEDPAERYKSLIAHLDLGNMIYGLFRRNVLLQNPPINGYSTNLIAFTDAQFLTNIVLSGKVIQIPEFLFIRRRGEHVLPWHETLALTERVSFPNTDYMSDGVTLPTSESIQEHVRRVFTSTLPRATKLHLAQYTYDTYKQRFSANIDFEVNRAVNLAKEGRFTETWNGSPEKHPDKNIQNQIDKIYAGLLLDRLERTAQFMKNHSGIHMGRSFCLKKMGRKREAEVQLEVARSFAT